jgi:hypothetical protein
METIPTNSIIQDTRFPPEFKIMTLSGYRKVEVKKALIDSMLREKIEHACNWSAEFICSGHYSELWDILLLFLSKHICLANPKLPLYLKNRYSIFRELITSGLFLTELELRNDDRVRKLFTEIICVFTLSKKKNGIEHIKMDREEEFDMTKNKHRFKAPSLEYAQTVLTPEDPKELSIAINELVYSLSVQDTKLSCYWVDWMVEFDSICRSRKEPCYGRKFGDLPIENKYRRDIVWLIWESIVYQSKKMSIFVEKTVQALHDLFCIQYTSSCSNKRRHLIYYAISLITETVNASVNIIDDPNCIEFYKNKINEVYKNIKKNEIVDTSLQMSEKEQNMHYSMDKLKALDDVLFPFDKTI